ncbi:putative bifunctional diguanylate cyclase/phosphodiesterase [Alteromonas flava]|uniref:putative bifunctional diguanylate cyclase/phosphodiesterase n=1 Tax=Alteromonas flava TaxID=2048003 RepID=UPI000C285C9F|nr:bifunctional diguanylate cyclase/phosphodiesterase [Alteromonas flava]
MPRRVSIAQKFIVVLVLLLTVFSVLLVGFLINRANQSLISQQSQIQQQYYKQFSQLNTIVTDRNVRFVENFINDLDSRKFATLDNALSYIKTQYEELLLRWQVEKIWLHLEQTSVLEVDEQGREPNELKGLVAAVTQKQSPEILISCTQTCVATLAVPVLIADNFAIVSIQYSLAEALAAFVRASSTEIALVNWQKQENNLITIGEQTIVLQQRFNQILQALPTTLDYSRFYQFGEIIDAFDKTFLLNIIPLDQGATSGFYLLTVTDFTERATNLKNQQAFIITLAVVLSLTFITLVAFLLRHYRNKLTNLSQRLPLLAENRFDEFNELRLKKRGWFQDELDQLEESATQLAKNLEQLNQQSLADQMQLEKMAMFDGLTGLPNRSMLMFQLEKHIGALKRTNKAVALMLLDLDDFKRINDSHGHGVGDKLLEKVAKRISKQLRIADIAARFGGDEFAILLTDVESMSDAVSVAEKIVETFKQPVMVREHRFFCAVSIGIAVTHEDDAISAELLRHTDIAMYEAKTVSGSAYRCYDAAMNRKLMRRVELENEARQAIQSDQFYLALQPKVALTDGKLLGFEALIRWQHPQKGQISPAEFIPILEKTALMGTLDYWVIAHAMQILAELRLNGYHELSMAINVSAQQFLDSDLTDYLRQQLRHHDIPASRIELELTETALVDDLTRACSVMSEVRELGCKIAIDDFGTGYSSLSYLKALPVDVVKIDRSFVSGMLDDHSDRNIVFSTISMVRGLNIEVVAEGIETLEQFELLCEYECNVGQGYYISKPIDESALWETLSAQCQSGMWQLHLPVSSTE